MSDRPSTNFADLYKDCNMLLARALQEDGSTLTETAEVINRSGIGLTVYHLLQEAACSDKDPILEIKMLKALYQSAREALSGHVVKGVREQDENEINTLANPRVYRSGTKVAISRDEAMKRFASVAWDILLDLETLTIGRGVCISPDGQKIVGCRIDRRIARIAAVGMRWPGRPFTQTKVNTMFALNEIAKSSFYRYVKRLNELAGQDHRGKNYFKPYHDGLSARTRNEFVLRRRGEYLLIPGRVKI